jgi:hypothetical protein
MRKDFSKNDEKRINEFNSVDYDLFLDNTPIIKYENKEMAEKIQENIQSGLQGKSSGNRITWQDFKSFMKLILAQTFAEKIDVFFEVFDLDKNSCFSRTEIFKICNSCLA